jgi:hypothetical protein
MEDCKIARQVVGWNPQGKMWHGRKVSTWKVGIGDRMQRRDLEDEECSDLDLWSGRTNMSLG